MVQHGVLELVGLFKIINAAANKVQTLCYIQLLQICLMLGFQQ